MKIYKVLNNNVVVVKENNQEKIVMGRGIAFKKHSGDNFDDDKIEKTFLLQDDYLEKFKDIIINVPLDYLNISEEIISYAKLHLGKKISDMIYISLTDHITSAIKRHNEGIDLTNALLYDIKRFYPEEYEIGKFGINLIKEKLNVDLSQDEIGFIALHFVNAQMDQNNVDDTYKVTKLMQEICNIVKYKFKIDFNADSVHYYRFITHLKFFAQRIIADKEYEDGDDDLLEIVSNKYHNAYECVLDIEKFLNDKYNYRLSDEEKAYLTIHINRIVYKNSD